MVGVSAPSAETVGHPLCHRNSVPVPSVVHGEHRAEFSCRKGLEMIFTGVGNSPWENPAPALARDYLTSSLLLQGRDTEPQLWRQSQSSASCIFAAPFQKDVFQPHGSWSSFRRKVSGLRDHMGEQRQLCCEKKTQDDFCI